MVTNFYGEGTTLFQNLGDGLFTDRSAASGIALATRYLLGFGIAMADVTNHGRLDVMITNGHVDDNRPFYQYAMPSRLYENRPDGRLVDVSGQAGECWKVERVGRGLAAGDLDNDGRVDAVIVAQNEPLAYFHNRTKSVGPFRDVPARRDEVEPRWRRGERHGDVGRAPPGRPAHRRRQLSVGKRPTAPLRPGRQRSRRLGRSSLALGTDRPLDGFGADTGYLLREHGPGEFALGGFPPREL